MPANYTYTFTLGQVSGKWIKPIDLEVNMGDIVKWQIPASPLIEFKITGDRNPFESLGTGVFATYGGRISGSASGIDWKYTLEYKFNNAHFIIDPKKKVKPKPGPEPNRFSNRSSWHSYNNSYSYQELFYKQGCREIDGMK